MRSLLAMVWLLGSLTLGWSQSAGTNWSQRISSKREHSAASLLNPHVNAVNVLIVDGRRFEHVRGVDKFYLPTPQLNAIVFVVDEPGSSVACHVYKMDSHEDIVIHASNSVFGHAIGLAKPKARIDTVEDLGEGKIALCTTFRNKDDSTKASDYLDLNKKAVVAKKTIFYDKDGKILREYDESPPF